MSTILKVLLLPLVFICAEGSAGAQRFPRLRRNVQPNVQPIVQPIVQPKAPSIPDDILPHERSGTNKYPPSHNVFTNNLQEVLSRTPITPDSLNIDAYLDNLSDYRNSAYGSEYMRLAAYNIANGGANQSIDKALVNTTNTMNSRDTSDHRPLYRLGENSDINAIPEDFEVLVITGSGNPTIPNDVGRFIFDASTLRHAVTKTYDKKCREFHTLNNPNRAELEAAIIARTKSAGRDNRRLYIVYTGHGNHNGYQAGIAESDQRLQGSRRFVFGLDGVVGGFTEDDYKKLLNTHASDVRLTSIILACHSGAAVTAIDPFFRRNIGPRFNMFYAGQI